MNGRYIYIGSYSGTSVIGRAVFYVELIYIDLKSSHGYAILTHKVAVYMLFNLVCVDSPHGGMDGGCSSAAGVPEKGINLNILLNLRDLLSVSGYEVVVTRDTDRSIHDSGIEGIANQKSSDMDNRLAIFNERSNAVCISIHQNQFTDPKYSGAQMFYAPTNKDSERLAQKLQDSFHTRLQSDNDREIKQCGKELFLCYFSKNPTVMVECGFLSNPEEAARLTDEAYQRQVAFTIYAGLQEYLAG